MRKNLTDKCQKVKNVASAWEKIAEQKQRSEVNDVKTTQNCPGSFRGRVSWLKAKVRRRKHQGNSECDNEKVEKQARMMCRLGHKRVCAYLGFDHNFRLNISDIL